MSTQAQALAAHQACSYSSRSKVIVIQNLHAIGSADLGPGISVETIPALKLALLCRVIAESEVRIAAIFVTPMTGVDLVHKRFVRRVRELASAEGALLVWDETILEHEDSPESRLQFYGIKPDIVCAAATERGPE